MAALEPQASKADRAVAVLVAPFVLGWDVARSVFFFLCRLMEKLDPFAAVGAVFGWIAPPVKRLARTVWEKTFSLRLRIRELALMVYGWLLRVIRPVVRLVSPAVEWLGRLVARGVKIVVAKLSRSVVAVRRFAEPGVSRVRRIFAGAFAWVVAPIRRAAAAVRAAVSRGAFWS